MMTKIACGALHGVDAFRVDLEVDYTRAGLPGFTMVGLAEGAVKESRDRVFAALRNINIKLPPARVTVNLAPADRKKGGSSYDLPLAIGLLSAAGFFGEHLLHGYFFAGELSLSGEVKPVPGILPLAILARSQGAKAFFVPQANAEEAAVVEGLTVYAVESLGQAIAICAKEVTPEPAVAKGRQNDASSSTFSPLDFADVKGQEHAKRAIEIAAAGGHNLLFLGPPGSGKTMLARRMPTVLPPLAFEEALEVTKIYSVSGVLPPGTGIMQERPFRSPHHTISEYGLVGGGVIPRPGEISLAHRGVLFLDELLEFRKQTLEVLRQPLENGSVTIARAALTVNYPADFMLLAAMNPCPCGYLTDTKKRCTCSEMEIQRYRSRLSGPLLDRIDLHVEVPAVPYEDLRNTVPGKSSAAMRDAVMAARARQDERYKKSACRCNADLSGRELDATCALEAQPQAFLGEAVRALNLSARSYTRILRIARTIADLGGEDVIQTAHLAEAVNCRALDRSA